MPIIPKTNPIMPHFLAIFLFFILNSAHSASCGINSADSSCFSTSTPAFCGTSSVEEPRACPSGLSGQGSMSGTRNLCTNQITWNTSTQNLSSCTNCTTPFSDQETKAVQNAILEALEDVNIAFNNYACPNFSCPDGTLIVNPLTNVATGVSFRDHVWVPDAFSTNLLPTTNRTRYLGDLDQIETFVPPIDLLPKDQEGNPINDTRTLYLMAYDSATTGGYTVCGNDGPQGCNISCTTPTNGFMDQFCTIKTVQYYVCSDGPAVFDGASSTWTPTRSATVPFTDHFDYTNKEWDWDTIFSWNSLPKEGGSVYMCKSTIQACTGWQTTNVFYSCKNPGSGPCPTDGSQTCTSCSYSNAEWDWNLYQINDCPITQSSTRTSNNRLVWQSDYPSQCNSNPLPKPTSPGVCPPGLILDPSGTACSCPSGSRLNTNGSCEIDASGSFETYTIEPAFLASNYESKLVPIGFMNDTTKILNNVSIIGGNVPAGITIEFQKNQVFISGTPSENSSGKSFTGSLLLSYNAGTNSLGSYNAGSLVVNFSISVSKFETPCVASYRKTFSNKVTYFPINYGTDPKIYPELIGESYACSSISNFNCKTLRTQYLLSADLQFQCQCDSDSFFDSDQGTCISKKYEIPSNP